jgi:hypothetical protein
MNGMFENGKGIGWPFPIHSTDLDAACAGVFFVKNAPASRAMMRDWVYGPENASAEIQSAFRYFAVSWAREQSILNRIIFPMHKDYFSYYSFHDFVNPKGSAIRHIWSA